MENLCHNSPVGASSRRAAFLPWGRRKAYGRMYQGGGAVSKTARGGFDSQPPALFDFD